MGKFLDYIHKTGCTGTFKQRRWRSGMAVLALVVAACTTGRELTPRPELMDTAINEPLVDNGRMAIVVGRGLRRSKIWYREEAADISVTFTNYDRAVSGEKIMSSFELHGDLEALQVIPGRYIVVGAKAKDANTIYTATGSGLNPITREPTLGSFEVKGGDVVYIGDIEFKGDFTRHIPSFETVDDFPSAQRFMQAKHPKYAAKLHPALMQSLGFKGVEQAREDQGKMLKDLAASVTNKKLRLPYRALVGLGDGRALSVVDSHTAESGTIAVSLVTASELTPLKPLAAGATARVDRILPVGADQILVNLHTDGAQGREAPVLSLINASSGAVWSQAIELNAAHRLRIKAALPIAGGGFLLAGGKQYVDGGPYAAWTARVDSSGKMLSQHERMGVGFIYSDMAPLADGMVAHLVDNTAIGAGDQKLGDQKYSLVGLSADGKETWTLPLKDSLGRPIHEECFTPMGAAGLGTVVVGPSSKDAQTQISLLTVTADGREIARKAYPCVSGSPICGDRLVGMA